MIQVGIFTGGKSPAMSKKLKSKTEKALKSYFTKEDIGSNKNSKDRKKTC